MIFYFSGTGNTKWAASKLAAATHDSLISIAPYMRADDTKYDMTFNRIVGLRDSFKK
ncbi:MAG: hypothetical protein ACOCO5_05890 [Segatella copri]